MRSLKTPTRSALIVLLVAAWLLAAALPAMAQDGTQHTVQPGENLFRIALRYGVSVNALAAANNIANTAVVYTGQVLVVPAAAPAVSATQAAPAAPPPDVAASATNGVHIVASGETLNMIARRYGLTLAELLRANNISDANLIYAGQRLTIPGAAPAAPAATQAPLVNAPAPTAAPTIAAAAPATTDRVHVVKRGEGLAAIARNYGISLNALIGANNIGNPDLIYAGMVLRIPAPGSENNPLQPAAAPAAPSNNAKQILVVLREQRIYAYENGKLLRTSLASTGLPRTPTVQGTYKIYLKYKAQTMSGPGYYLPSVPWVMYFYQGYGIHGTYWHSNFGRPMSHGCVNLPTPEAAWFFAWAEMGTPVTVRW